MNWASNVASVLLNTFVLLNILVSMFSPRSTCKMMNRFLKAKVQSHCVAYQCFAYKKVYNVLKEMAVQLCMEWDPIKKNTYQNIIINIINQ